MKTDAYAFHVIDIDGLEKWEAGQVVPPPGFPFRGKSG
jgi:hypothetical protein